MTAINDMNILEDAALDRVSGGSLGSLLSEIGILIDTVTARPCRDAARQIAGNAVSNAIEVINQAGNNIKPH